MLARLASLIAPPLCIACGFDAGRAAPLCRDCRAAMGQSAGRRIAIDVGASGAAPAGAGCWAAFPYDGPAGAVVRALKFGGRTALADFMAGQLVAHAPAGLLCTTVVPVPVHARHRRRRGIDHAHALAGALARRAGLPICACLARTGDSRAQVGRGRRERIDGPMGTISVTGTPPRNALIVDDVVTTGATLRACIRALREAGVREVSALAYARTTAR